MKSKLIDEIKELFSQSVNWAKLEMEYIKLTAAEKLIILAGTLIMGAIFMLLLLPVIVMFLFALVGVFRMFMPLPLAYLTVGGIVLLVLLVIFILRKRLIINPVSRFISKLFLEKNHQSH
ncbi:MAG: phage holin family protein [Muribaculaceae bacterium]|nr:phage holin family protein [Muribaculaceae bacterium]